MVLNQKETMVAYRCPECGSAVQSMVGVFTLTADMLRLKCPCQKSSMTISYTNDKKIRLTVPCFACPKPHNFTLSSKVFFDKELFTLPCPYIGLDIAFIGKQDDINEAMAKSLGELSELLGGASLEELEYTRSSNTGFYTDPQVREIIMFVISDLQAEGKISCGCVEEDGDYTVDILEDSVIVTCKKCGCTKKICTDSVSRAHDFLECDNLKLE